MSLLIPLLQRRPAWLEAQASYGEVIVTSRARLARNVQGFAFRRGLDADGQTRLTRLLQEQVAAATGWNGAFRCGMADLKPVERQALRERRLVSRELATNEGPSAVQVSADQTLVAMINEEDHLRLQVLRAGLGIAEVLHQAIAFDRCLEGSIPCAVHPRLGYLTSCPTNVGTGLRLGVMAHLPGLAFSKELPAVLKGLSELHLAVRGSYGEGSEAVGHFYQISNQRTLGRTEDDIATALGRAVSGVIRAEHVARDELLNRHRNRLEDQCLRAWGLLLHARRITADEFLHQIGWVRLGMVLGLLPRHDIVLCDLLMLTLQPAHLQVTRPEAADPDARDLLRADALRQALTG